MKRLFYLLFLIFATVANAQYQPRPGGGTATHVPASGVTSGTLAAGVVATDLGATITGGTTLNFYDASHTLQHFSGGGGGSGTLTTATSTSPGLSLGVSGSSVLLTGMPVTFSGTANVSQINGINPLIDLSGTGYNSSAAFSIDVTGFYDGNVAIGYNARTHSTYNTAIGANSMAEYGGLALGQSSLAHWGTVAIGNGANANGGIAIGNNTYLSGGNQSGVIGDNAFIYGHSLPTWEIGAGTASLDGALNFEGNPLMDGSGYLYGNATHVTGTADSLTSGYTNDPSVIRAVNVTGDLTSSTTSGIVTIGHTDNDITSVLGSGIATTSTVGSIITVAVNTGTTSATAAAGNDSRIVGTRITTATLSISSTLAMVANCVTVIATGNTTQTLPLSSAIGSTTAKIVIVNGTTGQTTVGTITVALQGSDTFLGGATTFPIPAAVGQSAVFSTDGSGVWTPISNTVVNAWILDGNGNWSSNANWSGAYQQSYLNTAFFPAITTAPRTITVDTSQSICRMKLVGLQPYSFISGSLTLTNSGTAAPTITVTSGTHAINSVLTGSNGLAKAGSGTLILTGTNIYTGTTNITTYPMTIGGSGMLGSGTYAGAIIDNGSFNYASTSTQVLTGTISGAGTNAITVNGGGKLILDGSSTYTGATAVTNGVIQIGNGDTKGNLGTGITTTTATSGLQFNRTDPVSAPYVCQSTLKSSAGIVYPCLINSGAVQIGTSSDMSYFAADVKSGATLILAEVSTSSIHCLGAPSLVESGGTIKLAGSGTSQHVNSITIQSGATADLNGQTDSGGGWYLSGSGIGNNGALINSNTTSTAIVTTTGTLSGDTQISGPGNIIYSGVIAGANRFKWVGPGVLTIAGNNTYSSSTTLTGGTTIVIGKIASTSAASTTSGLVCGTGTAAGSMAIGSGAAIMGGTSTTTTGTFTTGALTFSSTGSQLNVGSNGTTGVSLVKSTGSANLGGASWNIVNTITTTGTVSVLTAASITGTMGAIGTNASGHSSPTMSVSGTTLNLILN